MLVKFDSDVGGFTMFGDVAVQLLKMMGHSGTVPSAIVAKDIPAALARLQAAIGALPPEPAQASKARDEKEEPKVSLRQRAYPLVDLLERAAKANADVLWNKA